MTNPTFDASVADIDTQSLSTTHTVGLPSHATGDMLIVLCCVGRVVSSETLVISGGSGAWTVLYNSQTYDASDTLDGIMASAARIAASASESDPTYTIGTSEDEWCDVAFAIGGATDTIGEITKSIDLTQFGDGIIYDGDCPALTVSGGDNAIIYYAGSTDNDHLAPVANTTPPNGISYQSGLSGNGDQCCHVVATGFSSSSLSSGTWTDMWDTRPLTADSFGVIALGIPESAADPAYEQVTFRFRNDDGPLTEAV